MAQSNSAYRSADAVAGKSERLGVYGNVQKDCTSGPLPTVRVVTPPKHGELNVRSGTLKVGRITLCPKLAPTAQEVFYKANPGYKGSDEVSYEVRTASGKVEAHTVRITVKDASPAGSKPARTPIPTCDDKAGRQTLISSTLKHPVGRAAPRSPS